MIIDILNERYTKQIKNKPFHVIVKREQKSVLFSSDEKNTESGRMTDDLQVNDRFRIICIR